MRTRSLCMLCICLLIALAACNSKPADNTAANSAAQNTAAPNTAAPNSTTPSSDNSGGMGSSGSPSNAQSTQSSPMAQSSQPAQSSPMAQSAPAAEQAPPPPPPPVVVPTGTTLTVKLGETLSSKANSPGDTFTATVSVPVSVDGNTVIPAGARVHGTVVDAKPLGRFKGGAVLEVRLVSVSVKGTERSISTAAITRTQKGKGKRTATMAGGGTAFGAIVGGLAGGGKGAAIGALAGAGAGGAGAAFTGNKDIVLPAESALSFRLTAPLTIKQAQ